MEINATRGGDTTIKLNSSEQRLLRRVASLTLQIGRNHDDGQNNETLVASLLEARARDFGPPDPDSEMT
jgi:hypothetical protein